VSTLGECLLRVASGSPNAVAVHLQHAGKPDLPITYEDLVRRSRAYARCYHQQGIAPGEVIILILQHGEDLVYSFWGAILHGAIPSIMPFLTEKLSAEQYRSDLAVLISVTRPSAIVTYPAFEGEVRAALGPKTTVRSVISASSIDPAADVEGVGLPAGRSPRDVVLLQHSSGTTGLQKGVALSHEAVLRQLEAYAGALSLNSQDVIVSWLPLYHDMGLIAGFLMPILRGVPLVVSSPFDWVRAPWRLLDSVSRYRGTLSWLPNFAYNFSAQKIRDRNLEGVELSSWRAVINCSEPVKWESHRAFFERFEAYGLRWSSLQTCYAMAENVFGVTQSDLEHEPKVQELDREAFVAERVARPAAGGQPALRMMSSGRPLSNTQLKIVDSDGTELPDAQVGEIALRSDCMLTGYYNRPRESQEALRDGWYLTGDYGYLSEGELFVSGRKKDMIIVGGKNVYPQDLEFLSYEIPGVHAGRTVAFGVYNAETGTEDVYMVAESDALEASEQERIADLIREHVTRNSAISLRHVRVVGPRWILKTSSGKTARAANRAKFLKELDPPATGE
jgi:fatty-acyl-CoA synthase